MKIIVSAFNINTGGGLILLNELIKNLEKNNEMNISYYFDYRTNFKNIKNVNYDKNTIISRIINEYKIYQESRNVDLIINFGNLPPLFKNNCKTITFVQNRLLIDNNFLRYLCFYEKIKTIIQRAWFKILINNSNLYVVQTLTMQKLFNQNYKEKKIIVKNFYPSLVNKNINLEAIKNFDFIYPADGNIHKNHLKLFKSFVLLSKIGYYPSLIITINSDKFTNLMKKLNYFKNKYKLRIINIGNVDRGKLLNYYLKTHALIYPSLIESFGLPLAEAQELNKPILASNFDFITDICNPHITFNPNCENSILNAIVYFLENKNNYNINVFNNNFNSFKDIISILHNELNN